MALSPLIHQWFLLFLPYQSLAHCRSIVNFLAELSLHRSVTSQRKVYLLYLQYTVYCFQNVYLWAFLPPSMDRLRQGDFLRLVIQEDSFSLVLVALVIMFMYFLGVFCFTMKSPFCRLLEDIFAQDRTGTLTGIGYGANSGQATAQFILLSLINLLNVFILFNDATLLFGICKFISTAIQSPGALFGSPLHTPFSFTCTVCWILLSTWNTVTCMALYVKICINVAALATGLVIIFFRRLYHSETILAVYSRKSSLFSWAPFRRYLVYSGQTFQLVFTANHIFGPIFFAFLLVHMPISAWILVQLFFGGKSLTSVIALSFLLGHELFGCILIHWTVAKFTKRLHGPSKTLISWNSATGHRMGNFRARLLLHHTVVRLHTKAKYGFTYSSVGGLITFGSFGKCMLLYIELLMYAYKLICDI